MLDCVLIGVCVVIRSNMVYIFLFASITAFDITHELLPEETVLV